MTVPRHGRRGTGEQDPSDLARRLGALLVELNLSEIEVSTGDVRVRLQRGGHPAVALPGAASPTAAAPAPTGVDALAGLITIEAPMVGTFYRASAPEAEPYVREGDAVKQGQVLCVIEAMKLMNEIESKISGRIHKILVENGQAVEYGQPLFLLAP
jgi:acetyl-CoA carboxylase biotin carboxyl carrier protein